jgi:hypothetical protein
MIMGVRSVTSKGRVRKGQAYGDRNHAIHSLVHEWTSPDADRSWEDDGAERMYQAEVVEHETYGA